MAKNKWIDFVKQYRRKHPGMNYKELLSKASKSKEWQKYKKGKDDCMKKCKDKEVYEDSEPDDLTGFVSEDEVDEEDEEPQVKPKSKKAQEYEIKTVKKSKAPKQKTFYKVHKTKKLPQHEVKSVKKSRAHPPKEYFTSEEVKEAIPYIIQSVNRMKEPKEYDIKNVVKTITPSHRAMPYEESRMPLPYDLSRTKTFLEPKRYDIERNMGDADLARLAFMMATSSSKGDAWSKKKAKGKKKSKAEQLKENIENMRGTFTRGVIDPASGVTTDVNLDIGRDRWAGVDVTPRAVPSSETAVQTPLIDYDLVGRAEDPKGYEIDVEGNEAQRLRDVADKAELMYQLRKNREKKAALKAGTGRVIPSSMSSIQTPLSAYDLVQRSPTSDVGFERYGERYPTPISDVTKADLYGESAAMAKDIATQKKVNAARAARKEADYQE
jgi:hypothetical protein